MWFIIRNVFNLEFVATSCSQPSGCQPSANSVNLISVCLLSVETTLPYVQMTKSGKGAQALESGENSECDTGETKVKCQSFRRLYMQPGRCCCSSQLVTWLRMMRKTGVMMSLSVGRGETSTKVTNINQRRSQKHLITGGTSDRQTMDVFCAIKQIWTADRLMKTPRKWLHGDEMIWCQL